MEITLEGAKVGSLSQDLVAGHSRLRFSLPLEVRDAGIDRRTPGKQLEFVTERWAAYSVVPRSRSVATVSPRPSYAHIEDRFMRRTFRVEPR